MPKPKVAALRPDDDRIDRAVQYLQSLGVSPVADPMLTISPTGQRPQQAEYCIFTSKTGVELAVEYGWQPNGGTVCAVGQQTATALRDRGNTVDVVPSTFTSTGLVEALSDVIKGATVEVARSAHGSDVLIQGLEEAGGIVHETQLYRLERPDTAGKSVLLAVEGELNGILFTSPKTVEHFFDIASERGRTFTLQQKLEQMIVGAIGTPTERALRTEAVTVDTKPDSVGFDPLAEAVVQEIDNEHA